MKIDPKIIFENKHLLVIDKPIGIIVHKDEREKEETVSDWLLDTRNIGKVGDEGRKGVVHRLDRNTSGVLVLAKDQKTFLFLKEQFKEHTVRKVYRAIVEGHIRHETGMISLSLARAKSDFRKRSTIDMFSKDVRGEEKDAVTRYKVLEKITGKDGKHYSYVECYPLTGRTHQIRAHFRGIRHPIIGDDLYGSRDGKIKATRSMLHALSININIIDDEEKEKNETFVSPTPKDMTDTLISLGFKNEA